MTSIALPINNRLAVIGAGGFGREAAWLASQLWSANIELTFLVDQPQFLSPRINGIDVMLVNDYAKLNPGGSYVAAIGDPTAREKIVAVCSSLGLKPHSLQHPNVEISPWVEVDLGSIICAGSVLTTNICIGAHVHINLCCTIGHDVQIGDFATLSPGAHVSGHVHIGRRVFIGTGANIINGSASEPLTIGDDAVVAAGACVTRNVAPGTMVAGVPAVRKR